MKVTIFVHDGFGVYIQITRITPFEVDTLATYDKVLKVYQVSTEINDIRDDTGDQLYYYEFKKRTDALKYAIQSHQLGIEIAKQRRNENGK